MKFFTFSFLTLAIWTVSVTAQSKEIFCEFAGDAYYMYGYKFNVGDLEDLKRCTAFVYGEYFFDRDSGANDTKLTTQILEADKITIRSIVKTGRPVYVLVGYMKNWNLWMNLLNATDPAYVDKKVAILVSFLKEYKIGGIIYDTINLYYNYPEPLTKGIMALTKRLKDQIKTLKVGLLIYGFDYTYFGNDKNFNFTDANNILDHYVIDMSGISSCSPKTKKDGVNPIRSDDPSIKSIEKICIAISQSHMDKSKVFALLQVIVTESQEDALAFKDQFSSESYKQVCLPVIVESNNLCLDAANNVNTTRWCFDTTEMLYNVGQFVAKYTGNIMVMDMEIDDFSGDCKCGKFIATNTIIDGWQSGSKKSCDTFDKLKPAS